jgi:transglutaminase-like putative cysteine protease
MLIRYGFRLGFQVSGPTTLLTRLDIHPDRRSDIVGETPMSVQGSTAETPFIDIHGNLCRRMVAPPGTSIVELSGTIRDSGNLEPQLSNEPVVDVKDLPEDVLVYLSASRYCETDELSQIAWNLFGHLPVNATRVRAVVDFVHGRLRFGYPFANSSRTAMDAYNECVGVCRDFTHLTVALCRSLNIPTRYVNGYLGDIGMPRDPAPMDFSAWAEVFVAGKWWTVDARHNQARIGRIVLARGRDAADVPLIHTFGPHVLSEFKVTTEEVDPQASQLAA